MACEDCPNPTTTPRVLLTTAEELDALPNFSVGAVARNGLPLGKGPDGKWYVVGYTPGYTSEELIGSDGPVVLLSVGKVAA